MIIDSIDLWVSFYNVPVSMMTVSFVGILAWKVNNKVLTMMGPVQDFLCAKVTYPLEEALKPTVDVKIKGKGAMFFEVMYENVSWFRFKCGRMGHAKKFCPEDEGVKYAMKDGQLVEKYGEWMRSSPHKKRFSEEDPSSGGDATSSSGPKFQQRPIVESASRI